MSLGPRFSEEAEGIIGFLKVIPAMAHDPTSTIVSVKPKSVRMRGLKTSFSLSGKNGITSSARMRAWEDTPEPTSMELLPVETRGMNDPSPMS